MNNAQAQELGIAARSTRSLDPKVILAFAIIYVVWGSTFLAIRYAIGSIPPFLMAGLRFTIAGLLLFGWNWFYGGRLPTLGQWKVAMVGGALMFTLGHGGLAWAEQRLSSGMAALILALIPAWVVLVDWLRPGGTQPAATVLIGLFIGLFGLVMLVGIGQPVEAGVDIPSALTLVFSGFAWAVGTVYTKHTASSGSASVTASMQLLSGGTILLLIGSARGDWAQVLSIGIRVQSMLALGYLIAFGTLIAFNAYVWLLGVSVPSKVATYAYVNPIIAVFLGWAFASEPVALRTLAAAAIIIVAVVIITKHQAKPKP